MHRSVAELLEAPKTFDVVIGDFGREAAVEYTRLSELRAIVEDDEETRACTDADAVALWLKRESESGRGGTISHEALAAAVETDPSDGDSDGLRGVERLARPEIEIVWTGPEADGPLTRPTSFQGCPRLEHDLVASESPSGGR